MLVGVKKMPDTLSDLASLLKQLMLLSKFSSHRCIVEKTGTYMPGNSGPSACKFSRHCGQIEGMLVGLGIPFEEVSPVKWMKTLGALPKDKPERKRAIKEQMGRMYPHLKVTLVNADALGILTYAMQRGKQ